MSENSEYFQKIEKNVHPSFIKSKVLSLNVLFCQYKKNKDIQFNMIQQKNLEIFIYERQKTAFLHERLL